MKNTSELLKALNKLGFRTEYSRGGSSTVKIYPVDRSKPFYSFHVGERGLHPLRRFARANWGIDLTTI